MTDSTHEQLQPLLAIYRDLPPAQQQRLQAHLAQCPVCAAELAQFQEMDRRLEAFSQQQRRRFSGRQPHTAALLAQIDATRRPAGRLQQLLASLSTPARVAAALISAVVLIAVAGLFVAWFNALSQGGPLLAGDGAPTPTSAASEATLRTIDPLLQALRDAGAAVTAAPNEAWANPFDDLFASDISDLWDITIDGEQAHIYAFDDATAAGRAAATVSRSGRTLTWQLEDGTTKEMILDYVAGVTPRYWRSGASLIYYTGENEATLALLDRLFGQPIAAGDLPDQPSRPGQGLAGGEWQGVTLQYDPYLAYDLRPEWRASGSSPQLWLHLQSLNLHQSAFAPALIIGAEPIDVGALVPGAPLAEAQELTFQNGGGARRLLQAENGETVYVAEGQRDGGAPHVALIYPLLAAADGYDPQPALLDALFSSLALPDSLQPPSSAPTSQPTPSRSGDCLALQRPALVLARQADDLDNLNLTLLNPLTGSGCTLSTQGYAPGTLAVSENVLFYARRDQSAGAMTVWEHPLGGEPAALSFTTTPALNAPWFGLTVAPEGDQIVWATFQEADEAGARYRSTLWLGDLQAETKTLLWQEDEPDTLPATIEPLHFAAGENLLYFARRPYGIGGAGPFPGQYAGLYTLSLDGGEPQLLFECDTQFDICLNDIDFERRLLAVATKEGDQPALRILDFDGSLRRQYTPPPAENYVGAPIFGPDGSVAFITANLEHPDNGPPIFRSAAVRSFAPPYRGEAQTLVTAGESLFILWHWLDDNHLLAGDWQDGQGLALLRIDGERFDIPQSGAATPLLILDADGALPLDAPPEPPPMLEPTSTPPAPDALQTVEAFVAHLEDAYNTSPSNTDAVRAALRPVLSRDFSFTIYPTGSPAYMDSFDQVLGHLSFGLFRPSEPHFIAGAIEDHLPPGVAPESFYTGEQPLEAIIYATGWGGDGASEALLYLTRQQGALRWAGVALSRDNFAPLPQLQTVAPPPGLIYRLQNEWRQVQANGDARLRLTHPGPLSFSPAASRAYYAEQEAQTLTLFDFSGSGPAISRTLSIDFSLMHRSYNKPWLDEQTVLLMLAEPGAGLTQGSMGQMALLDVTSGALQLLAPQLSIYVQPAPSDDGAIFYDNLGQGINDGAYIWRQGAATPLSLRQMAGLDYEPFHPSPSPDGAKVVARGGWPDDPDLSGYWLFDLQQQEGQPILGYSPPGTDAILPSGVFWHPSSDWLALQPQTGDMLQSGIWLMRAGGSERQFLGIGTANPLWLPQTPRLLFNATIDGQQRLQLLDLQTGERFWVNTPNGATPVAIAR